MEDLRIITTSGIDTVLDEATVQGFKTSVRGPLLRPGDAGYDEARTVNLCPTSRSRRCLTKRGALGASIT